MSRTVATCTVDTAIYLICNYCSTLYTKQFLHQETPSSQGFCTTFCTRKCEQQGHLHQKLFAPKSFLDQKPSTPNIFYTKESHRACTPENLFGRRRFTAKSSYTRLCLNRPIFFLTPNRNYTRRFFHQRTSTPKGVLHQRVFISGTFGTKEFLHQKPFPPQAPYTKELVYTYTRKLLQKTQWNIFTAGTFYTKGVLHQRQSTPKSLLHPETPTGRANKLHQIDPPCKCLYKMYGLEARTNDQIVGAYLANWFPKSILYKCHSLQRTFHIFHPFSRGFFAIDAQM